MKDKVRRKKVHTGNPKVNRMGLPAIHSKIESLLKTGDNSLYLKHLIQRACKILDVGLKTETVIRMVCSTQGVSNQQRDRYLRLCLVWGQIE